MQDKEHIFLSYSRVDTKFANRIASDLRDRGFEVWMDQSHIPGGKHWDNDIEEALKNAFVVVLIVSPSSAASENVKDEIAFAKRKHVHIIPLVHEEAETPLGWDRLQWIEINKNYHQGLDELLASIKGEPSLKKEIQPSKSYGKTVFFTLLAAGLALVSYLYLLPKLLEQKGENTQRPITQIESTSLDKRNIVVIGSNNSDINITQE